MKHTFEVLLMLAGVVVLLLSFYHPDAWGILLGLGLVFAPLTAGGMFLMYVALVGIPFGLGLAFGFAAKELFGSSLAVGVGFVAGVLIGGKFVLSDSFDRLFHKRSNTNPPAQPPK
jgi:hypothetical protein